jgi:hypothetical protein
MLCINGFLVIAYNFYYREDINTSGGREGGRYLPFFIAHKRQTVLQACSLTFNDSLIYYYNDYNYYIKAACLEKSQNISKNANMIKMY